MFDEPWANSTRPPEVPQTTTTAIQPGGRLNDLSGLLFNTLIIVSIAVAFCLLVYCLCSWCKLIACRLCSFGSDFVDEEGGGGGGGDGSSSSQRRRRQRRSRRSRVSPWTPWSTASSGLFPAPPPSYFESVEHLGMPPTPPPGYSSADTSPPSASAAAKPAEAEEAELARVLGRRPAAPGVAGSGGGHRSCPNIRLVASAPISVGCVDV